MANPYFYSPGEVIMVVNGVPVVGWLTIEVSRNEDVMALSTGADGRAARTRNANRSGRFTVTLMQGSPTNDTFSAAAAADELSGLGLFPVMVKDGRGRSRHSCATAWVVKHADAGYAAEHGERTWILETDVLDHSVGGS